MATDVQTTDPSDVPALGRPSLKITGLHIRGLKSIRSLDLPADGLGWNERIPDFLTIGGANGTGKTTLLEFLAAALSPIEGGGESSRTQAIMADEAWVDFEFHWPNVLNAKFRFIVGDESFVEANCGENWFGYSSRRSNPRGPLEVGLTMGGDIQGRLWGRLFDDPRVGDEASPGVVYFPSERRLTSPETNMKTPGKRSLLQPFIYRWERPKDWVDGVEARLYSLRWEDLNAKEEGRDQDAHSFDAFADATDRFFGGRKRLAWEKAELIVRTKNGTSHGLSGLSSGEKQIVLFLAELDYRWRPGSLILIDEPELHLHESFQSQLWIALVDWQKERGGQVFIATQSGHLFGLGEPDTKVLLGRRTL